MSCHLVALLVLAVLSQAKAAAPDPKLVRVYVSTEATDDPAQTAALRDSVNDVSAGLARKKKIVVIVDDEDRADVIIEVVERTRTVPKVVFGIAVPSRPGQPSSVPPPQRIVHLRVTLAHRDESVELSNKNSPLESAGGWKNAAEDIVKQCERWITENQGRIIGNRGRDPGPRTQDPGPRTQHPGPRTQHPGPRTQHPGPRTDYLPRTNSPYSLNCPFAKPSTSAAIG